MVLQRERLRRLSHQLARGYFPKLGPYGFGFLVSCVYLAALCFPYIYSLVNW